MFLAFHLDRFLYRGDWQTDLSQTDQGDPRRTRPVPFLRGPLCSQWASKVWSVILCFGLCWHYIWAALLGGWCALLSIMGCGRGLWQPTEERTGQRCQTWTEQVLVESWVSERASLGLAQWSTCGTTHHSSSGSTKQSRGVCKISEGPSGVLWCWDYENATGVFSSANGCVWKSTLSVYWASLPSLPLFTQRPRPASYGNMQSESLIIISNNKANKQYFFQAEIFCSIVLEHY